METIWCLFYIANEYNQPRNDLQAWWPNKPDEKTLASYMDINLEKAEGKEMVDNILKGHDVGGYRLEEIKQDTQLR